MSYYDYSNDYTTAAAAGAGIGVGMIIFYLAIAALMLVSMWKIFVKCGKPGWACLIPIYNIIVMLDIAGKPAWYVLLFFLPIANIYAMWVCYDGMAKKLGKSTGFTVGMILLPIIFFPILAFSKTNSVAPSSASDSTVTQTPVSDTTENVSDVNTNEYTQAPSAADFNQAPNVDVPTPAPDSFVNNTVSEPTPEVSQSVDLNTVNSNVYTVSASSEDVSSDVNNNTQM